MNESRPQSPDARAVEPAERWVPLDEAASVAGISASALRRWQRSGRLAQRLETGSSRRRTLVNLDEVLLVSAARAASRNGRDAAHVLSLDPASPRVESELRELLARVTSAAADAERRATAAEAKAADLRRRIHELESWVAENARFEQLEQVQLGRLLALASAEREERRLPLIASSRTVLLGLYVLVVVAFIVVVLTVRI
jgi:DNA-binding transcriptional MerR regulator